MLYVLARLFILQHLTVSFARSNESVYVSRSSGNDSRTCGKNYLPCRTIAYAILKVSEGSYVYLDGNNTSQNPYSCQPLDPRYLGIYPIVITKTVSLVGIGSRVYISCLHGSQWLVDGSKHKDGLQVSLHGLAFHDTTLNILDALVKINDSLFSDSQYVSMNFAIFNLARFDLVMNNVVFKGNTYCMFVRSSTSVYVLISITNSSFIQNGIQDFSTFQFPSILWLNSTKSNIEIKLRNCSFTRNFFKKVGMIFAKNIQGTTKILLYGIKFEENGHSNTLSGLFNGIFLVESAHVIMTLEFGFVRSNVGTFITFSGQSVQVNVSNTVVDKFYSPDKGAGVLNIYASISATLSVKDSCFRNGKTISYGSAIAMAAPNLVLTIQNSTFHNISNPGSVGSIYLVSADLRSSSRIENTLRLMIMNSSFSDCVSLDRGAVYVYAKNLILTVSESWFVRNSAKRAGGGLQIETLGNAIIYFQNVYFLENSAGDRGIVAGIAKGSNSTFNFTCNNVWFVDNKLRAQPPTDNSILLLEIERKISSINFTSTRFIRNVGVNSSVFFLALSRSFTASHFIALNTFIFKENFVDYISLVVSGQATLICKHSIFDSNCASQSPFFAATMRYSNITISNSTFVNNSCGMILMSLDKSSCLKIEDSMFVGNRYMNGSGGAMYIEILNDDGNQTYKRCGNLLHNVLIKNVWFQDNVAPSGGVLAIIDAKVEIVNCVFVNNFAQLTGGQITTFGSTDLKVLNSVLKQTIPRIKVNKTEFVVSSFLRIYSTGELLLYNTTVDLDTISDEPLILATRSVRIKIYKSSATTCPLGYALKFSVFYYQHRTMVIALDVSCEACDYNLYSLQRGHAEGVTTDHNFKCMPCPRGADCLPNIKSKLNFWGYKDCSNPPTLAFTRCPFGYCKSPPAKSSKYNDCQGKRTGVMCGSCSDGYTETLWSTYCTSIKHCNDYRFWILFLVLVLFMAILLVFKPPLIMFSLHHVLWFKKSTTNVGSPQRLRSHSITGSFSYNEEDTQDSVQFSSREQLKHDKRQFSGFLEVIFYFYQIAQLLLSSLSLSEFFDRKILPPLLGFFNFEPRLHKRGFLCPFPGLTPKTKLAFKILPVFGTMLAIFTIYFFHVLISKVRRSQRPSRSSYLQASIKTIFLSYTTLATVGISLIRCVSVAGEDRWFYNGNVVCYQWWQYASFAFNGIFVIPFIFALAWASLKVHRGTVTVRQFLQAIAFPLPFLLVWLFRVVCPSEGDDVEETENFGAIKEMLLGPYRDPSNGCKHGALYWQSVLIARRFVLVLIFCTVTEPSIRLFCMTLACVLVLFFHLKVKPFRNALVNNFESVSLLLLVVLGLINLFKSVFVGIEGNIKGPLVTVFQVFQWLQILILGLFPALVLLFVSLAIISLIFRVLYTCCRSLFNSIFRRLAQRRLSQDTSRLVNICENTGH